MDLEKGSSAPRVAVIGGGFCGAFFAAQLAQHVKRPVTISVVEPRAMLGGGVAYSAQDPAHRINVPATRMTLFPENPTDFDTWLRGSGELGKDPDALWQDGNAYPRRAVFGRYVAQIVAERSNAFDGVRIEHIRDQAVSIQRRENGYRVALGQNPPFDAELIVIATSHPPPSLPALIAQQLGKEPALIANPWKPDAFDNVNSDADIAIIGTGLTMADVVASLDRRGHTGHITAYSRRGLLPRGHAKFSPAVPFTWFSDHDLPNKTSELVRLARLLVADAARASSPWQAVFDDIRANGQRIWRNLDKPERRRLLRHLRVFWDAHRYRIAPQVEAVLDERQRRGSLRVLAASLISAKRANNKIDILLHPRRSSHGTVEHILVDRVIVTTGPSHGTVVSQNPVLQSLADQGLLQADKLGLGLSVDALGRIIALGGKAIPTIFVVGPLAREQYGELMGMPQVAAQPNAVAEYIAETLGLDIRKR